MKSRKTFPTETTKPCPTSQRTTEGDRAAVVSLRLKIITLAEKAPQKAAVILTEWLGKSLPSQKSKNPKKAA